MMWVPVCARVYRAVRAICTANIQLKINKELEKQHLHDAVFLYVAINWIAEEGERIE